MRKQPTGHGQPEQGATDVHPEKAWYLVTLLREHLTVVISAFLVTFAATKILIFSLGDYSIALAVMNAGQQFTILASTMFSLLVIGAVFLIVAPTMFPALALETKGNDRLRFLKQNLQRYIPLFFAWALILIAAPAYYIAVILIMIFWVRLLLNRGRKKKRLKPLATRRRGRKFAILAFSANSVLLVISLASAPWTPQENVAFGEKGSEIKVSGYVIGQQGKQLLLVEADKSSLQWVGEDSIIDRKVCAVNSGIVMASKPVLALVGAAFGSNHVAEECLSASKIVFPN
jgi:hypothetical protein